MKDPMAWEQDLNREFQVVQGLLIESEEQGAKREQDRIIGLLETLIGDSEAAIYVDEFIALIKRENE